MVNLFVVVNFVVCLVVCFVVVYFVVVLFVVVGLLKAFYILVLKQMRQIRACNAGLEGKIKFRNCSSFSLLLLYVLLSLDPVGLSANNLFRRCRLHNLLFRRICVLKSAKSNLIISLHYFRSGSI